MKISHIKTAIITAVKVIDLEEKKESGLHLKASPKSSPKEGTYLSNG